MYVLLAIGLCIAIMFGWGGYDVLTGRMIGKPWLFMRTGVFVVVAGSLVVAAIHTTVRILWPNLIEVCVAAEGMITGVASSFAGALFGMGVTVKTAALRVEDVRRIDGKKAIVKQLEELLRKASDEEKSQIIGPLLNEYRSLMEAARREGIELDEASNPSAEKR